MTTALEGGEGSASRPGRSLTPGKNRYPLYRRLGGPQGRSGQVRKISTPPGLDPRTVQPVASRYTVYATWPTSIVKAGGLCSGHSERMKRRTVENIKRNVPKQHLNFVGIIRKSVDRALVNLTSVNFLFRPK